MDSPSLPIISERLKEAWLYRKDYILSNHLEAYRLVQGEGDGLPGLIVDNYSGSYLITFQNEAFRPAKAILMEFLKKLHCQGPATSPPNFFWFENFTGKSFECLNSNIEIKTIREADLLFEVRLGDGQHTGLFLDQRENRPLVRKWAKKKKVLNLFCYTGAFTVAAFKGGAKEVHSVDLSKNVLKCLTRNLALNELPEENSHLYSMDVFLFLKNRLVEGEKFDLIILDPPSFSRTKGKNFSTEKNLAELIQTCTGLLAEAGKLFISLNTRKVSLERFQHLVRLALQGTPLKLLKNFSVPLDFHLTPEEQKNPYLKTCLVG